MTKKRYTIDVGEPVSIVDHGGEGPLIVCVHGLEGSALNWDLIAPKLTKTYRVIAPDLSGFGYTPPHAGGTSVGYNADVVRDVIDHFGGEATVIGNSMGALVSLITAVQYADRVTSLVLIDSAAPVHSLAGIHFPTSLRLSIPLVPWIGPRMIETYRSRITVEQGVAEAMAFVSSDPKALDPMVIENATEIATLRRTQPWSVDALVEATSSIAPYVIGRRRYASLIHRVTQPTLIIHGTKDRLVNVSSAKWIGRQRPEWTVALINDVGHVPMLEAPEKVNAIIEAWQTANLVTARP